MDQTLHPHPPVPARRAPRARWTPTKQRLFLAALLEYGSVHRAAQVAGMSRSSAHRLRARLSGSAFDRSWANAMALHAARMADPFAPEPARRPTPRPSCPSSPPLNR
jgi:AraC-like DNA-binding protein